jgi:hypothetical protein
MPIETQQTKQPNVILTGITAIVILLILIIGVLSIPITIIKDKLK